MTKKVDFLIIGSGIAGLSYALKVAAHGSVLMITKANKDESNTKYAQGGIAAVTTASDSFDKHVQDTLVAGDFICDKEIVEIVVKEGPLRIQELIDWGTHFDKNQGGEYDLAKEGGHSDHRILHHKDNTGYEIERALLQAVLLHPSIEIRDHYFALDIITQHHLGVTLNSKTPGIECYGIYALNTRSNEVETILAKSILMATGGCGHIYETTTNPVIATGDGVAMVYRAKGKVENMEFIQFHPTSLYNPGHHPSFLISEAVRGFGGILKTKAGEEFMHKYDERKSLAPRDIVARAIDSEMKIHGDEFVYLDCRHLNHQALIEHFPTIHDKCMSLGIDMRTDLIPVLPAAHYQCGGIKVDKHGKSSIRNLYAVGECACTGLHGANRLASNSLLEAVVFAHRAAVHATAAIESIVFCNGIPGWNAEGTAHPEEMILITQSLKEVQAIMSNYVGIVRSNLRLKRALDRLLILHNETETLYELTTVSTQLCELRNMIKVGYIILKYASLRKESIGLHFNSDYPKAD